MNYKSVWKIVKSSFIHWFDLLVLLKLMHLVSPPCFEYLSRMLQVLCVPERAETNGVLSYKVCLKKEKDSHKQII